MTTQAFTLAGAAPPARRRLADRARTIAVLTVVVWGAMIVLSLLTAFHVMSERSLPVHVVWRPVLADLFGAALSASIAFGLAESRRLPNVARAVIAVTASVGAAFVFSFISIGLIEPLAGPEFLADGFVSRLSRMTSLHVWVFAAHAGFFLLLDQDEARPDVGAQSGPSPQTALEDDYGGLHARWFYTFQAVFWSALALFSIANSVNGGDSPTQAWRLLIAEAGGFAATTAAHHFVLRPTRFWALHKRAALALGVSVLITGVYILGIFSAYFVIAPVDGPPSVRDGEITRLEFLMLAAPRWMFLNFPVFVGWSGFYLALDGARRLRAQEKRLYESMMLAKDAQVKMLRFQLNPHFLFNTLNAVSSLLLDRRAEDADIMLGRLARFLRFALEVSPNDQTTLEAEVEAQRLYLEIEQIRFEERLRPEFEIDPACADALVPTLILQPLLENAIKYGVSRSTRPVTVRITARRVSDTRLELTVSDDGRGAPQPGESRGGVGLSNVGARLRTIFGSDGVLEAGPRPEGGFEARLFMPFIIATKPGGS